MAKDSHTTKYLTQYAEPEIYGLRTFPTTQRYDNVVVIPAFNESSQFLEQFYSTQVFTEPTLVIVVINQPDDLTEKTSQKALYHACINSGSINWQFKEFTLIDIEGSTCDLLVIDKFTQGLPRKKGVGLARKIGADCACQLIMQGQIASEWIHSTDADATLPSAYFEATQFADKNAVAGCYNFYHHCEDKAIHQANAEYEKSLRYFVAGLTYANSPYNFFTIGSVLTFKTEAYASVRGFPKRSAGEDFYLLNKLAKLGAVVTFHDVVIRLEARTSDRVPFGTGPAVGKIIEGKAKGDAYCYYHPNVFVELKQTLMKATALYSKRFVLDEWLSSLSSVSKEALLSLDIEKFVVTHQSCNKAQFERQFTVWFDAFRTLKFIHFIRNNGYQDLPLDVALKQAKFTGN